MSIVVRKQAGRLTRGLASLLRSCFVSLALHWFVSESQPVSHSAPAAYTSSVVVDVVAVARNEKRSKF